MAADATRLADDLLGRRGGTPDSPTWRCPDPHHATAPHTSRDITIYLTRRGEQRWHCHGCGTGGTAIDLVMKTKDLGVRQALQHLRATPVPPRRGIT